MWQAYLTAQRLENKFDSIKHVIASHTVNPQTVTYRVNFKIGVNEKQAVEDMDSFCKALNVNPPFTACRDLDCKGEVKYNRTFKAYEGFVTVPVRP